MSDTGPIVALVGDYQPLIVSIRAMLEAAHFGAVIFRHPEGLLASRTWSKVSCVIAVAGPNDWKDMDSLEELKRHPGTSLIVISAGSSIEQAVNAMKDGAVDYLGAPVDSNEFLSCVQQAIAIGEARRGPAEKAEAATRLMSRLTPRECNVLEQLTSGETNRLAGQNLGISARTVEIHRAHIMRKMRARGVADLIRISLAAGSRKFAVPAGGQRSVVATPLRPVA